MKKITTRHLVLFSLFIALNVILTRLLSVRVSIGGVEGIRLGFGALPVILAGVIFGPLAGGIVGALGDVLGYFINPLGPYMPHFTLTAALTGLIPGLFLLRRKEETGFWYMLLAIAVGQIISSVILVPIFLQMLFKIPLALTLPSRIAGQVLTIPVYTMLTYILTRRINSLLSHGGQIYAE